MKKIFVLDTNVPMLDDKCAYSFEDNDIVIPSIVVKELNNNKTRNDEKGKCARHFTNFLDSFEGEDDIYEGVALEGGGQLKIVTTNHLIAKEVEGVFHELTNDEYVLSVAIQLHREYEANKKSILEKLEKSNDDTEKEYLKKQLAELKPVVLVSRDNNVRLKAKKFKVPAQTYEKDQLKFLSDDELYTGWVLAPVSSQLLNQYYIQKSRLEGDGDKAYEVLHPELKEILSTYHPYANQYIVLVDKDTWVDNEDNREQLYDNPEAPVLKHVIDANGNSHFMGLLSYRLSLSRYSIFPRNLHQKVMVDMLFDPATKQKSIIGTAGSGKTLFALLVSIVLTNDLNLYDEIIITRPPVEAEYELGFLPGNEEEKMNPYLRGFQGNLKFIVNQMYKHKPKKPKQNKSGEEGNEYDFAKFNIRTESMGFMRGETTFRQIVIIDESQNSTRHAMKTALTRIGEESLIIILGDISQIDFHLLDASSNGLSHAVELMKDDELAGHITLAKGERSELSKRIAEKWDTLHR